MIFNSNDFLSQKKKIRIGYGFDVHKFGGSKPLIVGGVNIPFSKKVIAHSDGDVMMHALIDAILGAMCCGDIGTLFPDSDDRYNNINSRKLLKISWSYAVKRGYTLGNADVTLILQNPKIKQYIPKICDHIVEDLSCEKSDVNIKATTTETLGYIGRSEGIACAAVVLLYLKNAII